MKKNIDTGDENAMRIGYLIAGYIKQTLTPEEHDELDRWVEESEENMLLFEDLTDEENIEKGLMQMQKANPDFAYNRIKKKVSFAEEKKVKTIWPYAVAASLILVVASLFYFSILDNRSTEPIATVTPGNNTTDILPGSDKAILTLADGRQVVLEQQATGDTLTESTAKIIKLDSGQIAYSKAETVGVEEQFNTLTTPKGGQYQIILSDGTKVWINSASTLRFPVVFNAGDRIVELNGEAYFEVVNQQQYPFIVKSSGQQVKVLGTKFNISAYSNDEQTETSLLEGKVELSAGSNRVLVKPGQQYLTSRVGNIKLNPEAHIENAAAWKDGIFKFTNATLEKILKEISRWYDAEIVYEAKIEHHFHGEISRKLPVSKVLKLLEKTGRVNFKIEGNKIIVKR